MKSYIGIDYGTKRIGLSWGSDDVNVAVPLNPIVNFSSMEKVTEILRKIIVEKSVNVIVIGLPLHMDGTKGKRAIEVENFSKKFLSKLNLPIIFVDELLSTYSAKELSSSSKNTKSNKSGKLDSRSATIILQEFLDNKHC